MLRLVQKLQRQAGWAPASVLREYTSWPADIPVPDGLKPFDPNGSLAQVDTYMKGIPEDDSVVTTVRLFKNLRTACDKLAAEHKARGPSKPSGMAALPDGSIDETYYTNQGFPPAFISGVKSVIADEASKLPTAKPFTAWADTWKAIEPHVSKIEKSVLLELEELQKKERELLETEERLDDLTIDEVLEMYPQIAQEIKDEIEAGEYDRTNAGHKLEPAA